MLVINGKEVNSIEELFSDKARWTQGAYARDASGNSVGFSDNTAVCWCFHGAFKAIYYCGRGFSDKKNVWGRICDAMDKLFPDVSGVVYLNDEVGYEAVMKLAKEAKV